MSDGNNDVPETLETLGEKITALGKSIDARFAQVDARFAQVDARFDEVKTHIDVRVEALDAKVNLVYDTVIAQNARNEVNDKAHDGFEERLANHDTRILALENPKPTR
jgi:hypothetical protein